MKLFRDKGVLEYSLMLAFSALMMFTWYHPLTAWLNGDETSVILSTIIIGILAFFGNILKSKLIRDEYLFSLIKSNVMGFKIIYEDDNKKQTTKEPLITPKTFAGVAGLILFVLLIVFEIFGSTQTALTFSNSIVEKSVQSSGLYQNLKNNALSGKDESDKYEHAMDRYATAKAEHNNNCVATWDEKHMTKRQECFNGFDMKEPTETKVSSNADVSNDDYKKIYADKSSENAVSNAFLVMGLIFASTIISLILLYLDFVEYKNTLEMIESSRVLQQTDLSRGITGKVYYHEALKFHFLKDIESKADSLAKQADGNCELRSAKNTLNQVEQYAEAEAIRDEAEAKRQQLKNQPIDTVIIPPMNPTLIKVPKKEEPKAIKKNPLVPKVELPKDNFFDEPKKEESETLEALSDRIIAISEKMEDNTIDIDGVIKLKLPTNKILSEELKMSESTLSDKLKMMETQGILVIKSWGGGNKRGRYIES
jgi:hypothetical protein